jgi:hypothetical protein
MFSKTTSVEPLEENFNHVKFDEMSKNYKQNLKKFDMWKTDYDEIDYVLKKFKKNKIKCQKYNNTLDNEVQKNQVFQAFITVSPDEERLIITNKVKCDDEYVLENDPEEL